jgi:hypothetical protein
MNQLPAGEPSPPAGGRLRGPGPCSRIVTGVRGDREEPTSNRGHDVTTTTDCPIWCEPFTAGQHEQLHGAHKASFAGATAQASTALVHRPGAGELTVEITVPSPSGGEQVVEMTAMAAVDLAEALTALTAEVARIGSAAPLAWPSQDQQNHDRADHSDGRQMPPDPAADAVPGTGGPRKTDLRVLICPVCGKADFRPHGR